MWKAQIDEIPYSAPYVQANVTQTVGTISVTGSVTVESRKAADDWAQDKSQPPATGERRACEWETAVERGVPVSVTPHEVGARERPFAQKALKNGIEQWGTCHGLGNWLDGRRILIS